MPAIRLLLKLMLPLAVLAGAFLLRQPEEQEDFDFVDSFSKGPDLTPGILQFVLFIPMIVCAMAFVLHWRGGALSRHGAIFRWAAYGVILFAHFISIQTFVWNKVFNPIFLVLNEPRDSVLFITVPLACMFSATTLAAIFTFLRPQEKTIQG